MEEDSGTSGVSAGVSMHHHGKSVSNQSLTGMIGLLYAIVFAALGMSIASISKITHGHFSSFKRQEREPWPPENILPELKGLYIGT